MNKKILEKVKKFIRQSKLISPNDKVLVALSGGADSVCLFHILNTLKDELNFSLFAFHLNHNIRKEAKDDEDFVISLCSKYNIPLYLKSENMLLLKEHSSKGLEEISRDKRYELIFSIMKEENINKTATAHHLLDNCESMLLNLSRGCGIKGLTGIEAKNDNGIIRPLLILTKEEILCYNKENNLEFVTDITNFDTNYSRNNIRHNILPHLEEINSNAYTHFYELSLIMKETEDLLNSLTNDFSINKENNRVSIKIDDKFNNAHTALKKQLLFKMLHMLNINKDISANHIDSVINLLTKQNKTTFDVNISNNILLKRRYDLLSMEINTNTKKEKLYYNVDNTTYYKIENEMYTLILRKNDILDKNDYYKYVDYDKIKDNIIIRTKISGDKFSPLGLKGSKLLKKYFIDKKIPKEEREYIPLLCDKENIIAVLGYDISEKYKVTNETKKILTITYEKKEKSDEKRH